MTIMVAGGVTFAVPGVTPVAYAEVTQSNTHLFVSAEGQDADNQFAQGNIIEVIVNDPTIGDTDEGEAEPNVSINGADLRMLQTANGDWRAYFAQADAIKAIDAMNGQLDYGMYCNENDASMSSSLELGDSNGVYFPTASGVVCGTQSTNMDADNDNKGDHSLIRETRALTEPSTSGLGQLGLSDADLWPFIQVFDFASESNVKIVYNRAGSQETVTLEFDDPSESHSLDRAKYPQGAEVLITIEDYALNIDPTDEDTWAFDTTHKRAYYNLFDEDGKPLNIDMPRNITDYAGKAGIGEQLEINRGAQGTTMINCQVTKDFGMHPDSDSANDDYLVVMDKTAEDKGACTLQIDNLDTPSANAASIFNETESNFVIGFVEDGSNNNRFINWAENQKSNLVVRDNAPRGNSFEVDYNAPDKISGVVGHFFAELTLGDSGATWNSGERIDFVVTDEDANTNPLAENDLTVANPDTMLVPSIRIGSPITLSSATGNVTWFDLTDPPTPPTPPAPDQTDPVISFTGRDNVQIIQNIMTTYNDGATCMDTKDGAIQMADPSDNVDITTVGNYMVTYTCTDSAGNTDRKSIRVQVLAADNVKPTITLYGDNPHIVTFDRDATYQDPSAMCSDNIDASRDITSTDPVNMGVAGNYTLFYNCTDAANNEAMSVNRTVTVTDNAPPTITLEGPNPQFVLLNDDYVEMGATCSDNLDAEKPATSYAQNVDTTRAGTYMVTYTCTDDNNNDAMTVNKNVTVLSDTKPTISIAGGNTVVEGADAVFTVTSFPPPTAPLVVDLVVADVAPSDFVAAGNEGTKTVTILANTATATHPVSTEDDGTDENNGLVNATITSGTTYTINNTASSATVMVTDNDEGLSEVSIRNAGNVNEGQRGVFIISASPSPTSPLTVHITVAQDGDYLANPTDIGTRTVSIPTTGVATLVAETAQDTTDETDGSISVTINANADYRVSTSDFESTVGVADDDVGLSEISIAADSPTVVEGTNPSAAFTVTANPAPTNALTVNLNVQESGDYVDQANEGAKTVIIPANTATAPFTVAIADDGTEEKPGTITVTVADDPGLYTVSSTNMATVTVTDNDATVLTAPGAPTGLTATAGNAQVVLSWTAPASDGGSPITDYQIEQNHNNGGWTTINDDVSTTTHYTVTGLINGDSYEFRVSAINTVGIGTESNVDDATPTAAPIAPGAPTGLTATAGNAQVVLSWTAPASDGGSPITDYQIEQNHNNGGWTTINDDVSTTTHYTVTGLINGDSYEFRVSAINTVGIGTESNVDDATPTAPRPLVLDDFGAVSWVNGTDGVHRITIQITGQIDTTPANATISQTYTTSTQLKQSTIELHINPDENGQGQFIFRNVTNPNDIFNDTGDSNPETSDLAVTADGRITATVILHSNNGHQALEGTTANFTLRVENVTAGDVGMNSDVFSNVISKMIPPIPTRDTNVVDMTTTPISGNAAGFPPITRAVINSVNEIPAVHNAAVKAIPTEKTMRYTWSENMNTKNVESFSDRLRLSAPTGDDMSLEIPRASAVMINDWTSPTFAEGVTTLFNWNFDSLAEHVSVTGVYLANDTHKVLLSNDASGLIDLAPMQGYIENLNTTSPSLIITLDSDDAVVHICSDITLVADFFTFGQTPDGDRVNNAIYRLEVEEATPNSADFEATLEYVMLNQLNVHDADTYTSLRTIDSDVSIIVHEDFTDEDSVRINYFDLGADGVSTQIAIQREAPTHSGVVSFDMDSYKVADTVTITLEDADLNVDNDVVDIYTVQPHSQVKTENGDKIGKSVRQGVDPQNGLLLEVTFNDEAWVHSSTYGTCDDEDVSDFTDDGLASTGFTLMETASDSGVFTGDFQIPNKYCEEKDSNNNGKHVESVTGVDIEVNYYDFRDASGEDVEVGAGAAIRANTGTVSLDRTVYPVPFDPTQYGTAVNDKSLANYDVSGDLGIHIRVNDPDFDVSAAGEDTIVNASEYLTVKIIRGAESTQINLGDGDITEVAPDAGVFELDLTIPHNVGTLCEATEDGVTPVVTCDVATIQQGDIIQVEYRDETDASGEANTITDSATFDLRNAVLQSDKSVYIIGSDMILTLIEPDFDLDNDGAETYPLDLIEWDSDAGTLGMGDSAQSRQAGSVVFDPEPSGLRETGDSTGIFQSIIEIPGEIDGDRLERGEEIELEYVDYGPSGSDYVGDETEDITLTVFTSNFGATIELDQKVYTWTDKVYITIVAPDHNFDSQLVDEIGESDDDPIRISTRSDDIDNYKLVETGADTGIFTGEIILIGFDHNADGETTTGTTTTGYDNPQRETSGSDSGPTNGYIKTDDDDGITVSFEFSEDETVVGSALIRWNIGEVQWLEASYPATGTGVVRVIDPDMNLNPESVDNFDVDVWSDKDAGGIDLTVTETNQATGIFEGTVFFTTADESSGHRLRVAEGDTVTAEYEDNTLPDPYTTADELDITATTLIGTIVPPLERAVVSNLRTVDAFENSLDTVSVDQQVQIVADLTSGQDRSQMFAYLVQVQDANGVTVSLAWISGTLEAGQSLSPSSSWIPTEAGTYTATAFVWESVDNPTALSPPVTTTITVS